MQSISRKVIYYVRPAGNHKSNRSKRQTSPSRYIAKVKLQFLQSIGIFYLILYQIFISRRKSKINQVSFIQLFFLFLYFSNKIINCRVDAEYISPALISLIVTRLR